MSGKAILIPGCNFQSANLGIVTIQSGGGGQEVALQSISIEQSGSYTSRTLLMSVTYQPFNTTQIGVSWSIVSGSNYATISANGVLTIDSSADASQVVVQATSTANSSITATTTLTLTYEVNAKYNVTWLLDSNTLSTSSDTQITADEPFTFTLSSAKTTGTIGDFKVMMGEVNISKQCQLSMNSDILFSKRTFTITTPPVTGDLIITNEHHFIRQYTSDNIYAGRIKDNGSGQWVIGQSEKFGHLNILPSVSIGSVIRYYFMPVGQEFGSTYVNGSGETVPKYILTPKIWGLNTTTYSNINKSVGTNVHSYVTEYSANMRTVINGPNAVPMSESYTIQDSNTVGVYSEISIYDYDTNTVPAIATTSSAVFTVKSNLGGPLGLVFKDVANVTGGTVFAAFTIDETILEGGYFEAYNYGVTEISSSN